MTDLLGDLKVRQEGKRKMVTAGFHHVLPFLQVGWASAAAAGSGDDVGADGGPPRQGGDIEAGSAPPSEAPDKPMEEFFKEVSVIKVSWLMQCVRHAAAREQ